MDLNNLFRDDREDWVIANEEKRKKELRLSLEEKATLDLYVESYKILINDFQRFKNSSIHIDTKINALNNMMNTFIKYERYEECTKLRDIIKQLTY